MISCRNFSSRVPFPRERHDCSFFISPPGQVHKRCCPIVAIRYAWLLTPAAPLTILHALSALSLHGIAFLRPTSANKGEIEPRNSSTMIHYSYESSTRSKFDFLIFSVKSVNTLYREMFTVVESKWIDTEERGIGKFENSSQQISILYFNTKPTTRVGQMTVFV